MKSQRWKKLLGMTALVAGGVVLGATISPAHAQRAYCASGFARVSPNAYGYVCQSATPTCQAKHVAQNHRYNSVKKRFDYKCTKEANVPK